MSMSTKDAVDLDSLDFMLVAILRTELHVSVSELARRTKLPRATVQSRIARLERRGAITAYGPDIDAARVGFSVTAFTTLEIAQGAHDETVAALAAISQVLEIHTVTGAGDLVCRIAARSNDDLHLVLQRISMISSVTRSETQIALSTQLHRTTADLIASMAPRTTRNG